MHSIEAFLGKLFPHFSFHVDLAAVAAFLFAVAAGIVQYGPNIIPNLPPHWQQVAGSIVAVAAWLLALKSEFAVKGTTK